MLNVLPHMNLIVNAYNFLSICDFSCLIPNICILTYARDFQHVDNSTSFQYPIRRLIVRSREVSKPWDLYLSQLSDRFNIWQAHRQQCCRCACQISRPRDTLNYRSPDFETARDLTIRRLIGYWNGPWSNVVSRVAQWGDNKFTSTWAFDMFGPICYD